MNHLIFRHPLLVVLGFWLTGAFHGLLYFFSNTAKLEIHRTCPQGYESTFFQDINWKPYSIKGGAVVRSYHEKTMGSQYRYNLLGFKNSSTANFRQMGAERKQAATNPALVYVP